MTVKILRFTAIICVLTIAAASLAADLTLAQAKSSGLVGEKYDGYLGAVGAPNAAVQSLIADVNGKRRTQYRRIADTNKITRKDVEQLAAQKAIDRTQAGGYVMGEDGRWRRK